MGLALGARAVRANSYDKFMKRFGEISGQMLEARPTAVNLRWAVERMNRVAQGMAGFPVDEIAVSLRRESELMLLQWGK